MLRGSPVIIAVFVCIQPYEATFNWIVGLASLLILASFAGGQLFLGDENIAVGGPIDCGAVVGESPVIITVVPHLSPLTAQTWMTTQFRSTISC